MSDKTPLFAVRDHRYAVVSVPISSLLPADSPRLAGESPAHARVLAETDAELPPILVHRESMMVIDGMHRLRAARMRGTETIQVRFFDGDSDAAFIRAVEENIAHGLPLSLADRQAAAARIIESRPELSDRAIAALTGLSARTLSSVRQRLSPDGLPVTARIGRDGRTRPLSTVEGRRLAGEMIALRPEASLREIAKASGISPGTARDVRERVRRGEDPVPAGCRNRNTAAPAAPPSGQGTPGRPDADVEVDRAVVLQTLRGDPSMRFSEAGRRLLRWLDGHTIMPQDWAALVAAVPPHCAEIVAGLARRSSEAWREFADVLEQRGRVTA